MTDFDQHIGQVSVIPQDIGRVFLNLFSNAFYAVNKKRLAVADRGTRVGVEGSLAVDAGTYEPEVSVATKKHGRRVEIRIRDNGTGIPAGIVDKIYQPFFTTKPTGEGTGLGLSLSYDIITKGFGGEPKVDTREGEYTEFIIHLPA